jgi:hypothetical protein
MYLMVAQLYLLIMIDTSLVVMNLMPTLTNTLGVELLHLTLLLSMVDLTE